MQVVKPIKLMLVDDHQIMIDGIKSLLKNDKRFEITGESTSCENALKIIPEIKPDIIITDISLPGMSGIEFAGIVHKKYPEIKILVLSMYGQREMIIKMLDAGVSGYLTKNTGKKELIDCLMKVYAGELHFSGQITTEIMKNIEERKKGNYEIKTIPLTIREKEIVRLIAREFTNKQIANALFISERTVETHRKNIFRKTNTTSLVGLVKYIIEQKLGD